MLDVLVVDDDDDARQSVAEAITNAGHRVTQANDAQRALSLFASRPFDVAVCDVQMPKMDGLTLCRRLRRDSPSTALVIMTSYVNVSDAIESLRGGVVDYVRKPFDPEEFAATVIGPIAERRAREMRIEEARVESKRLGASASLVGTSLAMRRLAGDITRAAGSDASLLIQGEVGVGKKLAARMIHEVSERSQGPFSVLACAALPDLIALSGGSVDGDGSPNDAWFRSALGGTLVLDGLERLPPDARAAVSRVTLDPGLVARRGHDRTPLGVRVISLVTEGAGGVSAWRDLPLAEPLGERVERVRVPPLRARDGDLYLLVTHFLRRLAPLGRSPARLTPRAWRALSDRAFPGNVQELARILEHAAARTPGDIDVEHLPEEAPLDEDAVAHPWGQGGAAW